jgi:hypothetical protein
MLETDSKHVWYIAIAGVVLMGLSVCVSSWDKKTSYIYSPGLFASPALVGKYCPCSTAFTGEMILGTQGGSVLGDGDCITAATYAEIDTQKPHGWFRRKIAPCVARKAFASIFGIFVRENPAGQETVFNYMFDFGQINIGQGNDIDTLRQKYHEHCAKFPKTNVVLFGDSRGAATIFNFIAEDHPRVACAVIEGVFDSIPHLIKHCFCSGSKGSLVEWSLSGLLKACAGNYSPEGPFPDHYVDRFPFDTPILLVTSKTDAIVPYQCTMRLYRLLLERGHTNVRLLILPHARHETYMVGKDKELYECCVHAFYEACGVAYDVEKAARGRPALAQTKPTMEELEKNYKIWRKCCRA